MRLRSSRRSGTTVVEHYRFETLGVRRLVKFGVQDGFSLGFDATGTMLRETYDSAGHLLHTEEVHFANTFAVRRPTGGRWLTIAVLPPGAASP